MRSIKYRAWNGKKLIYDVWVWNKPEKLFQIYNDFTKNWIYGIKTSKIVLMQSTDVYDIHNKEVYEGDIVKVMRYDSFPPYISLVYYSGGCFCTDWRNKATPIFDWPVEILGNIYENPKLLERI